MIDDPPPAQPLDATPRAPARASLRVVLGLSLVCNLALAALVGASWTECRFTISRAAAALGWNRPDPRVLEAIARAVDADGSSPAAARIEAARRYVYDHSVHQIDAEHEEYALDLAQVLERLQASAETGAAPPHLSCGPRAFALREVLLALGIPCRVVTVFSDDFEEVRAHTFVEARNADTGRWEAHDPDHDLCYLDARGERLAALDLVRGDLGAVVPSAPAGDGWEATGAAILRDHYFEALVYDLTPTHRRSVVVVNGERFRLDASFRAFLARRYRDPLVLEQ